MPSLSYRPTLTRLSALKAVAGADLPYADVDAGAALLDPRDAEAETQALRASWRHLRAGRGDRAVADCAAVGLGWRAALLAGSGDAMFDVTATGSVRGNLSYALFKQHMRALALGVPYPATGAGSSTSASSSAAPGSALALERAIFGVLSGAPGPALAASADWTDATWALFKCLVTSTVDAEVARVVASHAAAAATATTAAAMGDCAAPRRGSAGVLCSDADDEDADPILSWSVARHEYSPSYATAAGGAGAQARVFAAAAAYDPDVFACPPPTVDARCADAAAALAEARRRFALPANDADARLLFAPAAAPSAAAALSASSASIADAGVSEGDDAGADAAATT